jgi:hypothetical protein
MWTEENVLKVDVEGVVCGAEQCAVGNVIDVIYGMERGKGCVLDIDMELCVMLSCVMWEMLWMLYIWYGQGEGMCTGKFQQNCNIITNTGYKKSQTLRECQTDLTFFTELIEELLFQKHQH